MPLTPVEPLVPAVRSRRTTESAATRDPINRDAMRYQGFQFSYSVSQTGRRQLKLASSPTPPSQAGCKPSTSPSSIFGIPAAVPGLVPVPAPWGVPLARGPHTPALGGMGSDAPIHINWRGLSCLLAGPSADTGRRTSPPPPKCFSLLSSLAADSALLAYVLCFVICFRWLGSAPGKGASYNLHPQPRLRRSLWRTQHSPTRDSLLFKYSPSSMHILKSVLIAVRERSWRLPGAEHAAQASTRRTTPTPVVRSDRGRHHQPTARFTRLAFRCELLFGFGSLLPLFPHSATGSFLAAFHAPI